MNNNDEYEYGWLYFILMSIAVGLFFAKASILMALWNAVIVSLFSLPALEYWTACGLMLVCNILFKGSNVYNTKSNKIMGDYKWK